MLRFLRFFLAGLTLTLFSQLGHFRVVRLVAAACRLLSSRFLFRFGSGNRGGDRWLGFAVFARGFLRFHTRDGGGDGVITSTGFHLAATFIRGFFEAILTFGFVAFHTRFFLFKAEFGTLCRLRFFFARAYFRFGLAIILYQWDLARADVRTGATFNAVF